MRGRAWRFGGLGAYLGAGALAASVLVAVGSVVNRVAARRSLGANPAPGRTVVVVLGFRNAGTRINAVNRWRARAGVATAEALDADLVVFSGGGPGGAVEADLLAREALRAGLRRPTVRERTSRTTRENLAFSVDHLETATRIALVSNPLHAQRARAHLRDLRPDLADRLVAPVVVAEGLWVVALPLASLYELAVRLVLRASASSKRVNDGRGAA